MTRVLNVPERREGGRKNVRRDRAKAYRDLAKLKAELEKEKKRKRKYKQRWLRIQMRDPDTPRKKTRRTLRDRTATRRSLICHFSLLSELRAKYSSASFRNRQTIAKVLAGKVVKKYRCLGHIQKSVGVSMKCMRKNQSRGKTRFRESFPDESCQ